MLDFLKPNYLIVTWMALMSSSPLLSSFRISSKSTTAGGGSLFAAAQDYEQRSSTFDALLKFEPVRGSGNMTSDELLIWEDASSEFFAAMFDQLTREGNGTVPMLGPGTVLSVLSQERYVASLGNFGQINYGVNLEVNFVVTFQTDPDAESLNAGNEVLKIFDRDNKGNLVFLSPYLSSLRQRIGNTFSSVNRLAINVNGPRPIDLASPIPTLPLPPPTDAPSWTPSNRPTNAPTLPPTTVPSLAPTPSPTRMDTLEPTITDSFVPSAEITPVPSTSPPTAPDETLQPTMEPDPTTSPTKFPTSRPTLPLESFFATTKLSLEGPVQNLNFNATADFQSVTADYLATIIQDLLRDTAVEEVTVGLSSQNLVQEQLDDGQGVRRLQQDQPATNQEDEAITKLQVEFNTILKIRSTSSVNAPSLVSSAFGTAGRRENYRLLLVASNDPILNTITLVDLVDGNGNINKPATVPGNEPGGLSTGALVGIGVGATLFAVAILGIWYKANNKGSGDGDSQKGQIPTAKMSDREGGALGGRLDAEIMVDKNADDVSTLGDPFFGMSMEERTCADRTATSASVKDSYGFMKLMQDGANELLGTTKEAADEEEETASKVQRTTLYADDDASFEDMFGDGEM
ncbi:unnamed protein product [Cylindrotheca closterium]|uniref:Uncharacterized protein n=1 Tax=Cylindrotheca closterium TaxID=2856 RepID=A0AAD2G1T7_9STRA|nr:unnamed protein product [Cylindrotheca closterium]